ncbi:Nucleoporin nup120 [Escovopsis weberi]|uniref:Nucleoporin nup120 n=1 Tax=Escovopsis weberi TaxID=150374 RepID=A0A0M8N0G9_ESCWE|nr:Nucleoporin nup120 [Escovopsis weberi]
MDSGEIQYLFKETRLNLDPPSPSVVITVRVPPSSNGYYRSRSRIAAYDVEDETSFRSRNLASAASVYQRKWHDSPRRFLWRVLEDGMLLSVRAVDVCKRDKEADASLILNFQFNAPIQPGCIALSDPEEHDALCVNALDINCQLYTFTLRPDLFKRKSAVDAKLSEICKMQAPSGLSFKYPHRMVAVSSDILLVTVSDGGMIRFDRQKPEDSPSALWKETFFNVQGWAQNLRSMLPFQGKNTVRYGKANMEYSAATSIQTTSFGLDDCLFAITVCLDHRIRIWNVSDGQILQTQDLLNAERSQHDMGKWFVDPSQSNLIQIVGRHRGSRICATYSPVGTGEFKFWKITARSAWNVVIEDLFPECTLVPVTPSSSDIWTMADFVLSSVEEKHINLWTLWKNNMTYRVQRLELDRKNMAQSWESNWDGVFSEPRSLSVQTSGPCDPTDVTEKWLRMILQPGRFTKATLEVALAIYERGLGASRESSSKGRGLAESICSVLGSTASLERTTSGVMDYEQFRASSETQWRRFYRLLVELDKQRGEALCLAFDSDADMAWVICADLLSAIRETSHQEKVYHNLAASDERQMEQATLIATALNFVDSLSDNQIQLCIAALRPELFEESSLTDLERIQTFYDKAAFWRGITDEDATQVVDALGTNFSAVSDAAYRTLLDLLVAPLDDHSRSPNHPLTQFGMKLMVSALQENSALQWKICFSQLILLTHMEFEYDKEEDSLHNRVDVGLVFRQLVKALRRLELMNWLTDTEIVVPLFGAESGLGALLANKSEDVQVVTALEANVGHLLGFDHGTDEPLATSIPDLVTSLCAPDSEIEVSPTLMQCSLLKAESPDLASSLAPFCDRNPFSVYIQGRVYLALNDFEAAAISFRKAAVGMGSETAPLERHSSGLLDDTEWNLLNCGQASYYSHIVALYEKHRAYSYVADFSRLAIQFIGTKPEHADLKTDLLSRLFNAALTTSQFELAHTTLLSTRCQALRHSNLRKLVEMMCETYHNTELVGLPFPGMQQEVDDILSQRCKTLADIAGGSPYHQVLYSWRIKRNNYRGAASVILDKIQKLRRAGEGDQANGDDLLDTPVTKQYLLLINALSCVDPKQAWIFDESGVGADTGGGQQEVEAAARRKVVSLVDIRKQYQDELDRISAIQNNQFAFVADDMMDLA